ncbi:MAG: hypothetical protein IH620_01785 [Ignavibacterium sp.]|nr:hypothetical protein [Ignavibacterium sp.]
MAYNICVVDDQIPLGKESYVDAGNRISATTLQMLLNEKETGWKESVLKELVENLITDNKNWNVSAFMSPEILINSMEEEFYLPEFIIFDWDYGKGALSTEDNLKAILETSFSFVTIYTASDKKDVVQAIIDKDFKEFKNRLNLKIKSDKESSSELVKKISELSKTNFSFKFSSDLRKLTHKTLESILIEFGKPEINDITWLFGDEDESKNKKLHIKDLSEILVEKLRSELITGNFGSDLPIVTGSYVPTSSSELVKRMWAYRLYYSPKDNIVRKGDIIKKRGSDEETLFLVISSDCHLKNFWRKNFGFISLVPLHRIDKTNKVLLDKLDLYKSKSDLKSKNITPSSLTNISSLAEGLTIIPFIPIGNKHIDFLLFPKELSSQNVLVPADKKENKRNLPLKYEYFTEYEQNSRVTVSEPFITPLVEHILYNISGYGVPDYPLSLQKEIAENFKGIFE